MTYHKKNKERTMETHDRPLDAAGRAAVARRAAAESIVLLKNENATLPLPAGAAVAVAQPWPWAYCGAGSSLVRCAHAVDAREGLAAAGFKLVDSGGEAGVLVVSRFSREGQDSAPEDARLTADEQAALAKLKADGAKRIVVVLNLGCGFDVAPLAGDPAVGAILHVWFPGQEGGHALADVLSGTANPSGRLAATLGDPAAWPSDRHFHDSAFYVPYEEDVFVGYRWFETIPGEKEKAIYPFGHGLSYTAWKYGNVKARANGPEVRVTATVTNAGQAAGRHSLLLYSGVTGGGAEHPARELRAYAKTRLLAPGESETLTLSFPRGDLAYFADEGIRAGSWVLDRGEYALYLGGTAREAAKVGGFRVAVPEIVSSPGMKLTPGALAARARADGTAKTQQVAYDGPGMDGERPVAAKQSALRYGPPPGTRQPVAALQELPKTLRDVARGAMTLDDFIATLTPRQQCELCLDVKTLHPTRDICIGGVPMGRGVTPVVLENAGAGIRRGATPATAFPATALVACAFDPTLAEEVGFAIGSECVEADIDLLEAPGLNIHRHPLCGRNFEYFSEDPLVAGRCAAAYVKGVKATGTLTCLKHFAANDREDYRDHVSAVVSERALREIYLRGFAIAIKEARPESVMTGYNRVNGRRCGVFHGLIQGVLRDEWGFDGVVMSDFGAKSLVWEEIAAGSDVHMVHPQGALEDLENHVFQWGVVPGGYFHAAIRRILTLVMASRRFQRSLAAENGGPGV